MAGAREIRTKIKSVGNTRKVTRALEMVSASKIRKAQDLMRASRPYARAMKQVIGHLAKANTEYKHPFLSERETVKRVGYIIVSTDRGLCGGLNSNLFRKLLAEIRGWQEKNVQVDIVAIGTKANAFFKRLALDQFHRIEALPCFFANAELEYGSDILVPQRCGCARFVQKTFQGLGALRGGRAGFNNL